MAIADVIDDVRKAVLEEYTAVGVVTLNSSLYGLRRQHTSDLRKVKSYAPRLTALLDVHCRPTRRTEPVSPPDWHLL